MQLQKAKKKRAAVDRKLGEILRWLGFSWVGIDLYNYAVDRKEQLKCTTNG